jgi:hypothetical protein
MIWIPPKSAVARVIGQIREKSDIHLARQSAKKCQELRGSAFLGEMIFRFDGGARRGDLPEFYSTPQGRVSSNQPNATGLGPISGAQRTKGSDTADLNCSKFKSLGFARGFLLLVNLRAL